ncbi:MAG: hypothetical protein M5U26_14420 [Planctomycetota bacterium]|nr:hypothetical protein [Planctomycetota bacterium]
MRAGFAEIEITPPLGTQVAGWIKPILATEILDPLHVRAAVFESGGVRLGIVSMDTTRVTWQLVAELRAAVEARHGIPGDHLLVAATHNHAGPVLQQAFELTPDPAYLVEFRRKLGAVVGAAVADLAPCEWGFASRAEFRFARNRRVRMRDGTVKTHGRFSDPEALCYDGPIDPELAVLAFRAPGGALRGALVNYACHPTDHGHGGKFSSGWPGAMARELKPRGVPVALFLNGAAGNIATPDPERDSRCVPPGEIGRILADDVEDLLAKMAWRADAALAARTKTVELEFRRPSAAEISGSSRGTQRFIDPKLYDARIPAILEEMRRKGVQPAQIQAFDLDELTLAAIPAEYFVELGLHIKERAHPRRALVIGYANGMLGYVGHRDAYARGGYEVTFPGSRLAPGSGERLAEAALELIAAAQHAPVG